MTFNDLSISESAIETTGVQSQPDTLTGTAAENKLVFDALPQLIVARFNMLITQLQAQAAAEQLGVTPFTGMTATNLQDALEALQTNLTQAIAGVGTGLAGSSGAASVGFDSTEQITAATVQAAIEAVQQHLDVFKTQMTGSGGAASVGTAPISGLDATNVQAALAELRDDIQNIVSGIIPGGTITTNMLADGSVTAAKLNVTGEDIPTSTTDAISLSSQLSKKAMSSFGELTASDLLVWAQQQSVGGSFFINPPVTTSGLPDIPDKYFIGSLEIGKTADRRLILTNNNLCTFVNKSLLRAGESQMSWTGWKEIPTATPPQEYSLPLAEGITELQPCTYYKNQFGEVTVGGTVSGAISQDTVIGTLPVGFWPSQLVERPATIGVEATRYPGTVIINPYGVISITTPASEMSAVFEASFLAKN